MVTKHSGSDAILDLKGSTTLWRLAETLLPQSDSIVLFSSSQHGCGKLGAAAASSRRTLRARSTALRTRICDLRGRDEVEAVSANQAVPISQHCWNQAIY